MFTDHIKPYYPRFAIVRGASANCNCLSCYTTIELLTLNQKMMMRETLNVIWLLISRFMIINTCSPTTYHGWMSVMKKKTVMTRSYKSFCSSNIDIWLIKQKLKVCLELAKMSRWLTYQRKICKCFAGDTATVGLLGCARSSSPYTLVLALICNTLSQALLH